MHVNQVCGPGGSALVVDVAVCGWGGAGIGRVVRRGCVGNARGCEWDVLVQCEWLLCVVL